MEDQHAALNWRDGGVPVSDRFDDPYFSLAPVIRPIDSDEACDNLT